MADSHATTLHFPYCEDDSEHVRAAMDQLGFACLEFSDLTIPEMSMVISLAVHLKLNQSQRERWES